MAEQPQSTDPPPEPSNGLPSDGLPSDGLATTDDFAADAEAVRLVEILDKYVADQAAGKAVSREQLLAEHPDLADRLEACLAGIEFLHGPELHGRESQAEPKRIGDFEIGREIGRGGMGAVYEANQVSLGRRVALKIMRYGGGSDSDAVDRFQREAETVANLHHTNIVPIFSVGTDKGVNYYAMQYIEGESLDRVLRKDVSEDKTRASRRLDDDTIADWGLQAAEALEHAHRRNVIHRDVKPSNLILDDDHRVWLTDFGLAKRLDDVSLSMTGALLGTPRYMSPEQASVSKLRSIDHRTDIYSLGATLYELLTRQPVFESDTPHGVLQQILSDRPKPISAVRPAISRDLETIVMTCLAKDPEDRYETAQELADDLRAFAEMRPIRARRPSPIELLVRSIKRQKQSFKLALGSVAVTTLLITASLFSYFGIQQAQLAELQIQTDTPPLVGELVDADDNVVVGPFTIPMQQPIEVPSGDVRLQVSGDGKLSQTFRTSLIAGQWRDFQVNLQDIAIGKQIQFDRAMRVVRCKGTLEGPQQHTAFAIRFDKTGVQLDRLLRDGNANESVMQVCAIPSQNDLKNPEDAPQWVADSPGFRWWTDQAVYSSSHTGYGKFDMRPFVVGQADEYSDDQTLATDINDDGVADFVLAGQHQAWLLALSGKDMSVLWFAPRGADLEKANPPRQQVLSATLYEPISLGDLDGDGVEDWCAIFGDISDQGQPGNSAPVLDTTFLSKLPPAKVTLWAEAISGASGDTLWRHDFSEDSFAMLPGVEVPYKFRWFVKGMGSVSSGGGGSSSISRGVLKRERSSRSYRGGEHRYMPDRPRRVDGDIVCLAGQQIVSIDSSNGQVKTKVDLHVNPSSSVKWGDVDGDGRRDAIVLEDLGKQMAMAGYPPRNVSVPRSRVTAWSVATNKMLWQHEITTRPQRRDSWTIDPPDWLMLDDIDGDGCCDVIVPNGTSEKGNYSALPWGGVELVDGKTGKPIWNRMLPNMDQCVEHLAIGPDVDGDGAKEIYAATLWGPEYELYADCLSGADGATVQFGKTSLRRNRRSGREYVLDRIGWWRGGGDVPQLMISAAPRHAGDFRWCWMVEPRTCRFANVVRNADETILSDLDRDGVEELAIVEKAGENLGRDAGGKLSIYQGVTGERWRRLQPSTIAVADLDGDDVRDLISKQGGTLNAYSGATGDPLWETDLPRDVSSELVVASADSSLLTESGDDLHLLGNGPAAIDINGDGFNDLVVGVSRASRQNQDLLIAISGREGRLLWISPVQCSNMDQLVWLEMRDLDGDDRHEVVMVASMDYLYPDDQSISSADKQLWCLVLSSRSGRVRWAKPLTPAFDQSTMTSYRFQTATLEPIWLDANRDGVLDLVLPGDSSDPEKQGSHLELRALDGRSGEQMWAFGLPRTSDPSRSFATWLHGALVSDKDGRPVLVQPVCGQFGTGKEQLRLYAIDATSGQELAQHDYQIEHGYANSSGYGYSWYRTTRPRLEAMKHAGSDAVAIVVRHHDHTSSIEVLGTDLKKLASVPIQFTDRAQRRIRLWTADVDGGDGEELIFPTGNKLVAVSPNDPSTHLWEYAITSESLFDQVFGVDSKTLFRRTQKTNRCEAIDLKTGRLLWHCDGPKVDPSNIAGIDLLSGHRAAGQAKPSGVPIVRFSDHATGAIVGRAARGIEEVTDPVAATDQVDPRLVRPLPGMPGELRWREVRGFLWMALYSVTLMIIPLGFVLYLVWNRQFGLRSLLLAPVVLSIFVFGLSQTGPNGEVRTLVMRLMLAFFATPPTVITLLLLWWVLQQRWRRLAITLGVTVIVTGVLIVMFVVGPSIASSHHPIPGERYSYPGVYRFGFPAAILVSWGMFFLLMIQGLIGTVRRWRRPARVAV